MAARNTLPALAILLALAGGGCSQAIMSVRGDEPPRVVPPAAPSAEAPGTKAPAPGDAAAPAPDDAPPVWLGRANDSAGTLRAGGYDLHLPCALDHLMRGFKGCRRGRRVHPAVDIGGGGPDQGLGTPVRALVRARVTMIGRGEDEPDLFGVPDCEAGTTTRSGRALPRSRFLPGYGKVCFFTQDPGRWRSGNVVVLKGLGGGMDGYVLRYMHLGAIRPDLRVGAVVEAGTEIGLMGGTGVQSSPPHLHLDVATASGDPVDLKALFTGKAPAGACAWKKGKKADAGHQAAKPGKRGKGAKGAPGRTKASAKRRPGRA